MAILSTLESTTPDETINLRATQSSVHKALRNYEYGKIIWYYSAIFTSVFAATSKLCSQNTTWPDGV